MQHISKYYFLFFTIALFGCEKKYILNEDSLSFRYFPFPQNNSVSYLVDSLLFKQTINGLDIDTFQYIIKESWIDELIENGDTCYTIAWEARAINAMATSYNGQKRYCINPNRIVEWQNNAGIFSFIFPPTAFASWYGLASFDASSYTEIIRDEPIKPFSRWNRFTIKSVNDSLYLDGKWHDNLIRIVHVDTENAIEKRFSYALWSIDNGLLYSEKWILDTQKISNEPWENKAEKGYIVRTSRIL